MIMIKHRILPQPKQPNKQVQEYLDAFRRGMTGRFVVPKGEGWYVSRRDGSKRSLFRTKKQAIDVAKAELLETKGELLVFDRDGQVVSRTTPTSTS